jgi:anti-sigma B factor antagonist
LEIDVHKQSDINILKLRGAFRLGPAVESFRGAVDEAMRAGGHKIIVNLTDCNSMDSSGIGALVRCQTSAKQQGGAIKLVNPSKLIVQTLRFVGLLNVFEVHADDNAAVNSFSSNAPTLGTHAKDPAAGW